MKTFAKFYGLLSILALFLIPTISLAQIVVTSTADSGTGSLREAIETTAVNGDIITFNIAGAPPHTITLTSGEITIDNSITINGPGSGDLIISGNNSSRIFRIDDSNAGNTLDVSIRDVSLTDGNVTIPTPVIGSMGGGAILSFENLTLENCILSGNTTQNTTGGGAIYNTGGILNITSCDILQNQAIHDSPEVAPPDLIFFNVFGGGVYSMGGELNLVMSNISENLVINNTDPGGAPIEIELYGGGVYNEGGIFSIVLTCIMDNTVSSVPTPGAGTVTGRGGGVANVRGAMTINNSTIGGNLSDVQVPQGAGLYNQGDLDVMPSTVPAAIVLNTTISENFARAQNIAIGGGIYNIIGNMNISSTTIAFNFVFATSPVSNPSAAAGVFSSSSFAVNSGIASPVINLRNVLVVGNEIGTPPAPIIKSFERLDDDEVAEADDPEDIVAKGLPALAPNCDSQFDSMFPSIFNFAGTNISDVNTPIDDCTPVFDPVFDAGTMIGPLADNGGSCETNALIFVANNNAIDGVADGECTDQAMPPNTLDEDERMFPRPINFTGTPTALCDVGAFELQAEALITIIKVTDPSDGTGFGFLGTNFPLGCELMDMFTLDDGESKSCTVPIGTYTVAEVDMGSFVLTEIECEGADMFAIDDNSVTVTLMNFDEFECQFANEQGVTLDVTILGNGEGGVVSTDPGIDCNSTGAMDCTQNYLIGDEVTLTATPQIGSTFTGWSGDDICTDDPTNPVLMLDMEMNVSCIATFELIPVTLDVAIEGDGEGGVQSTNPGIDCNSTGTMDCDEIYNFGTMVTLTATPQAGSFFTGWSGDAVCTGDPTNPVLNLTMDADISCIATFEIIRVTLDVTIEGNGEGGVQSTNPGIDCNSTGTMDCDETYNFGTMVTLTATPQPGSSFTGWSGDAACTGDPVNPVLNLTMDMDISCIATFVLDPVTLDVVIEGNGFCSLTSVPSGINCVNNQGDCSETYDPPGATVDLTADPDPSSIFTGWSGDCSGTSNDTSITVNEDSTCIATCVLTEFVLNPVFPGLDDNINFITAENANPGRNVAFVWSNLTGSTTVGGQVCNGTVLGLNNPRLLAISRANDFGVATYVFYIPFLGDFEFQVQLQAVDIATCRTSNIVPQIIRKEEGG